MQSVENPSQKAAAFPLVAALQLNLVETTATEPIAAIAAYAIFRIEKPVSAPNPISDIGKSSQR